MKWLTISQIKRRSKTAKGALKVSYEHWNQLYTATAKELREALKEGKVCTSIEFCGLCQYRWPDCPKCVLALSNYMCHSECSLFQTAATQLTIWLNKKYHNWHTWKRACKALRDKLKELMEGS